MFLLGQAASLLAATLLAAPPGVGTISVPELIRLRSQLEEELGLAYKPRTHVATLRRLPGALAVDAPRPLPPEQAATWAEAVLDTLKPRRLVIVATLPAARYRGPGSPADQDLVFGLRSSAASSSGGGGPLPSLPVGTMVDGLAAALLTAAEAGGLPAAAVVGIQMGPAPDAPFVCSLAEGVVAALAAVGGPSQAVPVLGRAQAVAKVAEAADNAQRSSAGSSIFV